MYTNKGLKFIEEQIYKFHKKHYITGIGKLAFNWSNVNIIGKTDAEKQEKRQ